MTIAVVYVYPTPDKGLKHDRWAARFAYSYAQKRAGIDHKLVVVSNGGEPTLNMRSTFPTAEWLNHDDTGWDIGAYQKAAASVPCELMVFLGGSSYCNVDNWLVYMTRAWVKHGDALYGAMGNLGAHYPTMRVYPHIRTTGFWMPPALLNAYPHKVTTSDRAERFRFEHGQNCLTEWVRGLGLKALVVSTTGEYEPEFWDSFENGYHRGDQSALLVGDRICEPPVYDTGRCLFGVECPKVDGLYPKELTQGRPVCDPWCNNEKCWPCLTHQSA